LFHVRVGIGVFVWKNGKFLMGRRSNAHGDGTWSVPGGHLEFGESFEDAARREVAEETGLTIRNVRFGAVTNDYFEDEEKHYVTVWMVSGHHGGRPAVLEPDKFTELAWFDFDTLPAPLFLPWKQLLASQFMENIKSAAQIQTRGQTQPNSRE
jgi:8-oxo-dGTP diphosphatase